nr:hypothetical protein [Acidaminococcus fermentans]
MELAMAAENTGIFRIQTEYQPDAQDVQALLGMVRIRIQVLFPEGIVHFPHQIPGLHGDFFFLFQNFAFFIDQEIQPVVFLGQVLQQELFRFPLGVVHIINQELLEVAGNHIFGVHADREFGNVPFGLLKWVQQGTIRLLDGCFQVLVPAFLFNHYMGRGNHPINEAGVIQMDLVLKADIPFRVGYPINVTKEGKPELLTFSLFIAFILPIFCKILSCLSFLIFHVHPP